MHCLMSMSSARQASAQLRHIFAQYIKWWIASPSGWLTCPRAFGWRASILRMDMGFSFGPALNQLEHRLQRP